MTESIRELQMTTHRIHISLDGAWDFQVDPEATQELNQVSSWRTAQVPGPWQAQFDDLRNYTGAAWYRRTFELSTLNLSTLPEAVMILHFGAVDYHATVWLNGAQVGEHEGGYLPFEFDVT